MVTAPWIDAFAAQPAKSADAFVYRSAVHGMAGFAIECDSAMAELPKIMEIMAHALIPGQVDEAEVMRRIIEVDDLLLDTTNGHTAAAIAIWGDRQEIRGVAVGDVCAWVLEPQKEGADNPAIEVPRRPRLGAGVYVSRLKPIRMTAGSVMVVGGPNLERLGHKAVRERIAEEMDSGADGAPTRISQSLVSAIRQKTFGDSPAVIVATQRTSVSLPEPWKRP